MIITVLEIIFITEIFVLPISVISNKKYMKMCLYLTC